MIEAAPLHALRIPEGWSVHYNDLRDYADEHPQAWTLVRKSDLLILTHERRNRLLDLGWLPDGDPNGGYLIRVFEGDFTGREVFRCDCRDRCDAIAKVEQLLDSIAGQASSP